MVSESKLVHLCVCGVLCCVEEAYPFSELRVDKFQSRSRDVALPIIKETVYVVNAQRSQHKAGTSVWRVPEPVGVPESDCKIRWRRGWRDSFNFKNGLARRSRRHADNEPTVNGGHRKVMLPQRHRGGRSHRIVYPHTSREVELASLVEANATAGANAGTE